QEAKKAKETKIETSETEDFLSQLADDCVIDILSRIDHIDLDEFVTLSQRLSNISDSSRNRAVKIVASRLFLSQVTRNIFYVELNFHSGQNFKLKLTDAIEDLEKNMSRAAQMTTGPLPYSQGQQHVISPAITDRLSMLLNRFTFETCVFRSISIDENFLAYMEHAIVTPSVTNFEIVKSVFDENLSLTGQERFASILLSANLSLIHLEFECALSTIHESFLRKYSQAVQRPQLFVTICIDDEHSSLLHIEESFVRDLANYKTLIMLRLVVKPETLLPALMDRLRQKREGTWQFRMSRNVDIQEIQAALGIDLLFDPSQFCIRIKDKRFNRHKVTLNIQQSYFEPTTWRLEATFR
ncbi:hypothetical protein PENTCL1PPCAC_23931, partial [Pristionchus entomophagus]